MARSTLLLLVALAAPALAGCLTAPAPGAPGPEGLASTGLVGGSSTVPDIAAEGAEVIRHADAVELVWRGEVGPAAGPFTAVFAGAATFEFPLPPEVTVLEATLTWANADVNLNLFVRNADGRTQCRSVNGVEDEPATEFCRNFLVGARGAEETWTVAAVMANGPRTPLALAAPEPFELRLNLSVRPFQLLGPALAPEQRSPALGFSVARVSEEYKSGEPSLKVDGLGNVYMAIPVTNLEPLFVTRDGGQTFETIDIKGNSDVVGQAWGQFGGGGGDSEVFVTEDGQELYYADLWGGCLTVASSADAGASWKVNPLSCDIPISDRQWLWAHPDGHLWMNYNGVPTGPLGAAGVRGRHTVMHSIDGGATWLDRATIPEDNCARGNMLVDADGRVFAAGCNADGPGVAVSEPGLMDFTWHPVAQRSGEALDGFCYVCGIFTVIDADTAGNLYVVWADPSEDDTFAIWLSTSQDKGQTWTAPVRVNTGKGTAVLPWVAAGEPGHVAVAWYQTKATDIPSEVQGEWYAHAAESTNGLDAAPAFTETLLTEAPVQFGPICITGSACQVGRNLLDFLMLDVDQEARVHVAFNDGSYGGSAGNSFLLYARQTAGLALAAGDGAAMPAPAKSPGAAPAPRSA